MVSVLSTLWDIIRRRTTTEKYVWIPLVCFSIIGVIVLIYLVPEYAPYMVVSEFFGLIFLYIWTILKNNDAAIFYFFTAYIFTFAWVVTIPVILVLVITLFPLIVHGILDYRRMVRTLGKYKGK